MINTSTKIFDESLAMVNRAVAKVHKGLTVRDIVFAGEFEQAVFMIWVASRLHLFDVYLPKRRAELIEELLVLNPLFAENESGVFSRKQVVELMKALTEPFATKLSGLRQGQTSIRGNVFELIMKYPVSVLFNDRLRSDGSRVTVTRTPKKKTVENIDLAISVDDTRVIGLSVKGNVRERLRESIQRATNAMDKGYFSQVWHCVLTSGDAADKESLNTALADSLYHGHRIYTWTPLCWLASEGFPRGALLIPFSQLPRDIENAVGV